MKVFFTKTASPIPAALLPLEEQDTNHCSSSEMKLHWACQCHGMFTVLLEQKPQPESTGLCWWGCAEGGSTKDKHRPLGREAEAVTPQQEPLQKHKVEHKSPFLSHFSPGNESWNEVAVEIILCSCNLFSLTSKFTALDIILWFKTIFSVPALH